MVNAYSYQPQNAGEAPKAQKGLAYGRTAYAVPTEDVHAPGFGDVPDYGDGYAPALGTAASEGKYPDEIRTQKREPMFGGPRQEDIFLVRGEDDLRRRSDELNVATGWREQQAAMPVFGVFPEQVQDLQGTRPTAFMAPNNQYITVPYGEGKVPPPPMTGDHFSLADHRRKYEIYGMRPQGGTGVNTYRLSPKPWDTQLTYVPRPQPETAPGASGGSVAGNRSYRLG